MEYYKIGEKFEYDGVVLEVMERTHVEDCKKCYLKKECSNLNRGYSNHTQCYSLFRDSDDDVYYRLVEQCKTKDMEQKQQTETIMGKENSTIDLERLAELSGFVNRDIGLQTSVNVSPDNNNVDHPKHYNSHPSGIECITITRHHNFNIGNAIKYLWRAGLKHEQGMEDKEKQIEDLQKAIFYIKDEICRISMREK